MGIDKLKPTVLLINPYTRLSYPANKFPTGLGILAAILEKEKYPLKILDLDILRLSKLEIEKIEYFDVLEVKPFMFGMNQIFATFILPDEGKIGIHVKPETVEDFLQSLKRVSGIDQEASIEGDIRKLNLRRGAYL